MDIEKKIENYIRAAFPVLCVNTKEEKKSLISISKVAKSLNREFWCWSITRGIIDITDSAEVSATDDPAEAIRIATSKDGNRILVLLDPNRYFEDPVFVRSIRDKIDLFRNGVTLIFMGVSVSIPKDLEMMTTVVDSKLPNKDDLSLVLSQILTDHELSFDKQVITESVDAACGLTTDEASDSFALSIIEKGELNPSVIMREKCSQIAKKEYLQVIEKVPNLFDIGGLEVLIDWVEQRKKCFTPEARDFGLPIPKGVMLIGIPGCGKSLSAKTFSTILGVPLVRFDFGAVMGSLVGESEKNMRDAIATAEAMAPCVLWIDELDKQLSSGDSDGHEVTKRLMSSILTWLQEKDSPVFVVATANNIEKLSEKHPELLRKGRWDEVFFLDIPNMSERRAILKVHISKVGRNPDSFDLDRLAKLSDCFVGAEIEAAIKDAMYIAFGEDRDLGIQHIEKSISKIVPQNKNLAISSLRDWCKGKARLASAVEEKDKKSRKLDL